MTMQSTEAHHTAKRASRLVEITTPSAFLEFMTAGKHPVIPTDTIFSLPSPVAIVSQWHHRKTTIHVQAKNSNGTTVGDFNLCGRFTLLPSAPLPPYGAPAWR